MECNGTGNVRIIQMFIFDSVEDRGNEIHELPDVFRVLFLIGCLSIFHV